MQRRHWHHGYYLTNLLKVQVTIEIPIRPRNSGNDAFFFFWTLSRGIIHSRGRELRCQISTWHLSSFHLVNGHLFALVLPPFLITFIIVFFAFSVSRVLLLLQRWVSTFIHLFHCHLGRLIEENNASSWFWFRNGWCATFVPWLKPSFFFIKNSGQWIE